MRQQLSGNCIRTDNRQHVNTFEEKLFNYEHSNLVQRPETLLNSITSKSAFISLTNVQNLLFKRRVSGITRHTLRLYFFSNSLTSSNNIYDE